MLITDFSLYLLVRSGENGRILRLAQSEHHLGPGQLVQEPALNILHLSSVAGQSFVDCPIMQCEG
jgi:hypothetical protein